MIDLGLKGVDIFIHPMGLKNTGYTPYLPEIFRHIILEKTRRRPT